MILITGCPRTGTAFTAALFREHGLDVGHECWGRDGAAWWHVAGDPNFWRGFTRSAFNPSVDFVAHQVREPLATIGSMLTLAPQTWTLARDHGNITLNGNLLTAAMSFYLNWNLVTASRASYTYQVEKIGEHFEKLCELAGFGRVKFNSDFKTSRTLNTREHTAVSWSMLAESNFGLAASVRQLSRSYGYD